jgi:hypothetical protein
MAATMRKLEVGDTLSEVFAIYREQAGVLLPIAFWMFLVVAIVSAVADDDSGLLGLAVLVSLIVAILYQGVVVNLVRGLKAGGEVATVGELVSQTLPFLGPLFAVALLAGLGVGIGLVVLIVPGLFLLTIWAVLAPAVVIEHRGVFGSFRRSRELVEGSNWQVFGVVISALAIALVVGLILTSIGASIAEGPIVRAVLSAVASTITAPIEGLAASVLYYRLLELHELAVPPESVPPAEPRPPAAR